MRPFWRPRWARKTCWARRRATGWRAAWRARGSVARATGRRTDPLAPAPWIGRCPKALEILDKRVKTRRRPACHKAELDSIGADIGMTRKGMRNGAVTADENTSGIKYIMRNSY